MSTPQTANSSLLMPLVFVLLWSTGFIGAKLGLPHAEPMTFLGLRFGLVAFLLFAWMMLRRMPMPTRSQVGEQMLIGLLMHYAYLGSTFVAVDLGLEAGTTALILGLQPVAVAVLARVMLGERLSPLQMLGMAIGVLGVLLVVWRKLDAGLGDTRAVAFCLFGLGSIAFASTLQKRLSQSTPMLAGNMIQFAAATVACCATALVFEARVVEWTLQFLFALGWLAIILSLGAITLYYVMIRRGAAGEVSSLFFLTPPTAAAMGWALFGEVMGWVEIAGMGAAMVGVVLVLRSGQNSRNG